MIYWFLNDFLFALTAKSFTTSGIILFNLYSVPLAGVNVFGVDTPYILCQMQVTHHGWSSNSESAFLASQPRHVLNLLLVLLQFMYFPILSLLRPIAASDHVRTQSSQEPRSFRAGKRAGALAGWIFFVMNRCRRAGDGRPFGDSMPRLGTVWARFGRIWMSTS